ncbi:MAG TPA: hypothetical protein VFX88_13965 [Actinomycetota bacterium]|jgi:hypothetical protein|nr:hypothetical protein [Actinomycetota bacterium]
MDMPLFLVLAAAAIAAWALLFRGMDQALPSRTREFRNRMASDTRPPRERGGPATRPPLHPALVLALVVAALAVGILIGQERQGLGTTQEPVAEVVGQDTGSGGGEDGDSAAEKRDERSGADERSENADTDD